MPTMTKRAHVKRIKNVGLTISLMMIISWFYLYIDLVECQRFKIAFNHTYAHRLKYLKYNSYMHVKEINDVYSKYYHTILPKNACYGNSSLVIVVKSANLHTERRHAIRQTWGTTSKAFIYFSLGFEKNMENEVFAESQIFNDIILGSYVEKYRHNIYKTSLNVKWVADQCSHVKYVLFVDDDYFVNVDSVIAYAEQYVTFNHMYGYMGQCWKPLRTCDHKSYITYEEYPFNYWPDYLIGGSMLTSTNVIKDISRAIPYIQSISIDDVFVGIVAHLLNINVVYDWRFSNTYKSPYQMKKYYLTAHGFDEYWLYKTWKDYLDVV